MTTTEQNRLGKTLWSIADNLRGAMNADDFRDYMLSFLFLRYLSDNYEAAARKELGKDYPDVYSDILKKLGASTPLEIWYRENPDDVDEFESVMRRRVHYVISPDYLWSNITELARIQSSTLLETLQDAFMYIEEQSFESKFQGLFSDINLSSDKLGRTYEERNRRLCIILQKIAEGISQFSSDVDTLGDAYEYLIGQFAAGSGKKAGEFYTPQQVSTILSKIVILESQDPLLGPKKKIDKVLDFACGSGSLLLNVRKQMKENGGTVGKIYGQESNITTYNLARMNMLLHGVKDTEFEIHHGNTLDNDWDILNEMNPAKKMEFDAIVANPPFSLRWDPTDSTSNDFRFRGYGVAPRSAADFSFLLHGLHFLGKRGQLGPDGTMAIILPHGVLFRGGAEERIRKKLLLDGNIDTVIGLPANLFFSTGIPVCIIVLKKCKKFDDVLFINASGEGNFRKGKRQNTLSETHIDSIVDAYKYRSDRERYSRKVSMCEIIKNNYNLNISRYVNISVDTEKIDLHSVSKKIDEIDKIISEAKDTHNGFLKELGLPEL